MLRSLLDRPRLRRNSSFLLSFLMGCLVFWLAASWGTAALSQIPTQKEIRSFYQNRGIFSPKAGGELGNLAYAPVKLDGRVLFFVAAPAAFDEEGGGGPSPVGVRVQSIERRLEGVLKIDFDPDTLNVTPSILNGETVILVSDGKKLSPQAVLTVTELDSLLHGRSIPSLAEEGSKYLHEVLLEAWEERQPDYLLRQGAIAVGIALGTLAIAYLLLRLQQSLNSRWHRDKERLAKLTRLESSDRGSEPRASPSEPSGGNPSDTGFLQYRQQREDLKKQIRRLDLWLWLIKFGFLFLGLFGLAQILQLFPHTRELADVIVDKPRELISIWLLILLATKGIELSVARLFEEWKEQIQTEILFGRLSERQLTRIDTLADALKGVGTFFAIAVGAIVSLQRLGLPITPLLAGAGIVGFAISFGSQNLIKSMVLGGSNLLIDAYAVGDWIVLENVSGKVEKMNLFVTQIRNLGGSLITIPNSRIEIVENQTRDWSQVNLTIQVSYDADVDRALAAVRETAETLSQDPDWAEHVLEPPDLLGIDNLEHAGMAVRLLLKTRPGRHWKVGRELRRRLRQRFEREGIDIGVPKQALALENVAEAIHLTQDGEGEMKSR